MKNKILIVDTISESRGFFSAINLLLLTLQWCSENDLIPVVSSSVLSLYGTNPKKTRPFSEFFGELYSGGGEGLQTMELAHIHNQKMMCLDDPSVIEKLSILNRSLFSNLTESMMNFISIPPLGGEASVSVHFRGCDYLKNTPVNHTPNATPQEFLDKIGKLVLGKGIFVATDDISFINLAMSRGLDVAYFPDVYRKGPGRGVHIKSFLERLGFINGRMQNRKAYEVMRDVYWLSKNNIYIGSNSNLMYYSKLLNPAQQQVNLSQSN